MIQIELPCCDASATLDPEAETIRCEACAIEHVLAADARAIRSEERPAVAAVPVAA